MNKLFLYSSLLLLVLASGFAYSGSDARVDYDSLAHQGKTQLQAGSAERLRINEIFHSLQGEADCVGAVHDTNTSPAAFTAWLYVGGGLAAFGENII